MDTTPCLIPLLAMKWKWLGISQDGVGEPPVMGTRARYQSGMICTWVSIFVALAKAEALTLTVVAMLSIESNADGAKGRRVRLMPSGSHEYGPSE